MVVAEMADVHIFRRFRRKCELPILPIFGWQIGMSVPTVADLADS